jgi:hypothetical protein
MNKEVIKDDVQKFLEKQEKITGIYCQSDHILGIKIWNLAVKKIASKFQADNDKWNENEILSFLIKKK